jgi:nitrate reductase gamma subunit
LFPTILIYLGIALGGVAILAAVVLFWSRRRERQEEKMLRERSPHATLPPHPRHDDTDRWNLTR